MVCRLWVAERAPQEWAWLCGSSVLLLCGLCIVQPWQAGGTVLLCSHVVVSVAVLMCMICTRMLEWCRAAVSQLAMYSAVCIVAGGCQCRRARALAVHCPSGAGQVAAEGAAPCSDGLQVVGGAVLVIPVYVPFQVAAWLPDIHLNVGRRLWWCSWGLLVPMCAATGTMDAALSASALTCSMKEWNDVHSAECFLACTLPMEVHCLCGLDWHTIVMCACMLLNTVAMCITMTNK